MTRVCIVAAYAHDRVIGNKNAIPWRMRSDLMHLKNLTQDQVIILGRKTYESMAGYYEKSGRQMPGRLYIVLSKDVFETHDKKVTVARSLDEALKMASSFEQVYVIGGAQVYASMLEQADMLYITEIDAHIDGDAFFPDFDKSAFVEISRENHHKDELNEYDYSFVVLRRQHS